MRRIGHSEPAAPLVINDPAQLRAHCASRSFMFGPPLILQLPSMTPAEAFAAGERLNKARTECGCSLAMHAMIGALVISLAMLAALYGPLTLGTLVRLPVALLAAFIAAGLAKAWAKARARRRAQNEVVEILTRYSTGE